MIEVWKDVIDYEGLYQVSNFGRIKSLDKEIFGIPGSLRKSKILKPCLNSGGYLGLCLRKGGKVKSHNVHILVAKAFHENNEDKAEVNHIDANKFNNKADNLEWNSRCENMRHAFDNNLIHRNCGEKHHKSKLTAEDVIKIRELYENNEYTKNELSIMYGVSDTSIHYIIIKKNWAHI